MTPSDLPLAVRKPVRLSVSLPHASYCLLSREATAQGRSMSNLAAYLLELGLARYE